MTECPKKIKPLSRWLNPVGRRTCSTLKLSFACPASEMSQNLNDQRELFKKVSDYCDRIAKIPQYDFSKFVDPLAPWEKRTNSAEELKQNRVNLNR